MKKPLIFAFGLLTCIYVFAGQPGDDRSLVRKGDRAFGKAKIADALSYYEKALTINPKDCYANFQAGALLYLTDSARIKSITYFQNTIKYAPPTGEDTIIDAYYYLGNCYILKKQYDSAIYSFQKYLEHLVDDKFDAPLLKEVKHNIEMCKFAPELIQRSPDSASYIINGKYQPTYVKNLGSLVNTPYPEYAEVMLDHDSLMVFTSRRPASQNGKREYPTGSYYEDMFMSHKDNSGQWTPPSLFSSQLQIKASRLNLASVCISADNKTLFVFHKGLIYVSHRNGSTWSEPQRIQQNIKKIKAYMPSVFLSYDGKQLFLVTDKKGGYGGRDIYVSKLDDKGAWGNPVNLGPDINTSFDEDAPFLMPDNKTLFFSSKGHNGLGGYDIFKSVCENGKWSTPINVGAPINSTADDIFFCYDTTMKKGYFSSSRINEGYGDMDLYSLSFTCDNIQNTTVQGRVMVYDTKNISSKNNDSISVMVKEDLRPDLSASISVVDLKTRLSLSATTDTSGKYSLQLKPDTKYTIEIKTTGFLNSSFQFTTPHQCDAYNLYQIISLNNRGKFTATTSTLTGQKIDIENAFYHSSQPEYKSSKSDKALSDLIIAFNDKNDIWYKDSVIKMDYTQAQIDSMNPHATIAAVTSTVNSIPTAKNSTILFELNSATISSSNYTSLDSLAKIMHNNTKIKLQVNGYADNTGKEEHNQTLSTLRAKAVAQYLIKKGVRAANIKAEGKGTSNPVAQNDGPHNYLNRRAELIVIQ